MAVSGLSLFLAKTKRGEILEEEGDRAGVLSGNALDPYSCGPRFDFWSRHQLSWLRFSVVFLSPFKQIPG
jgi:hypothetical protein